MKQIKKLAVRGLLDAETEDPFALFVASTSIRYCYYSDTQSVLGNTFGMCVLQVRLEGLLGCNGAEGRAVQALASARVSGVAARRSRQRSQDFEGISPNLLARTIETVEGGGVVVLLVSTLRSLTQLYSLTMDVHSRLKTESHSEVRGALPVTRPFPHLASLAASPYPAPRRSLASCLLHRIPCHLQPCHPQPCSLVPAARAIAARPPAQRSERGG